MARYLLQGGYAPEAWAGLVKHPVDCTAAVRAACESLGGKLEVLYYTFGPDDCIVIGEVPDQVQAAAVGMAVASTGRYRDLRTLPLLTAAEIVHALQAAGQVRFQPAGTSPASTTQQPRAGGA